MTSRLERLAQRQRDRVFLSESFFAQKVSILKEGDDEVYQHVMANVDWDMEFGSREAIGDGVVRESQDIKGIRKTCLVDVSVDVDINDPPKVKPDKIKIDGEMFSIKRVYARDAATMTLYCVGLDRIETVKKGTLG